MNTIFSRQLWYLVTGLYAGFPLVLKLDIGPEKVLITKVLKNQLG